jgi:lysine/ornithine N-monooxygenase
MVDVDLLVVGAGPQALTLMAYLSRYAPRLLEGAVVVDPAPWLSRWDAQFSALEIPMLRSACVHHPDPEPYALIDFARNAGRSEELYGRLGRPGTALFGDFCRHLIDSLGLQSRRMQDSVSHLESRAGRVAVTLAGGQHIDAARVVVATNPVRPVLPAWLHAARERHPGEVGLFHSAQFPLTQLPTAGRLLVVGGGLTAAQVVEGAAREGGEVAWATRSGLRVRDLDVEPGWLGGELGRFHAVREPAHRVGLAVRARGGGSIPPRERAQIARLLHDDAVQALYGCRIAGIRRKAGAWRVKVVRDGVEQTVVADTIVAATGSRTHVRSDRLLRPLHRTFGLRHVRGLPVLTADLRPTAAPVHVMGPLALTQVGPATRTIIGARIAAERLVLRLAPGVISEPQYIHPAVGD